MNSKTKRVIVRNALMVSLVVGTLLNIINQTDALLGKTPIHIPHLLLNYIVPFIVSSFSAWLSHRAKTSSATTD